MDLLACENDVQIRAAYPRRDRARAIPIKERLELLGLTVFFDVEGGIDGGDVFPRVINDAVRSAKSVLGLWTPYALTRGWVQIECKIALDGGRLVAIALDAIRDDEVPALFCLVNRIDTVHFTPDRPHEGWGQTLASLSRRLARWAELNPTHSDATRIAERAAALLQESIIAKRAAHGSSRASAVKQHP